MYAETRGLPDRPEPGDGFVTDARGGYSVSLDGSFVGSYERETRAYAALWLAMERARYWPNLWRENERGNVEQFVFDPHRPRFIGNGWV